MMGSKLRAIAARTASDASCGDHVVNHPGMVVEDAHFADFATLFAGIRHPVSRVFAAFSEAAPAADAGRQFIP